MLGIMRKLKYSFNRQALNQVYISYNAILMVIYVRIILKTQEHVAGVKTKDADHSLFNCNTFSDKRIIMFKITRNFHPLSVVTLLFGKAGLSDDDNFRLFQAVQEYIKDTGIFAH